MKYRKYIEDRFLIDDPKSGQLVPFKFRKVQNKYYDELVRDYDIEKNGLTMPLREMVLKARREGFSSLVLALFAVDDLLNDNPTETLVISYRDDATEKFRKRYRTFLCSATAIKIGYSVEQIQKDPGIIELMAKQILSVDANEFELKHNKAHFYCGTASARVGGRGGVVQKLLFSEAAFYPDKKEMRAKEIIEGTLRQVDLSSGWVFVESTANGDLNHYAKMWTDAESGQSRFKPRFYNWKEFYTDEEFEIIKSEFTDKRMIPQEYPLTATEAFLSSGDRFFDAAIASNLKTEQPTSIQGDWKFYGDYQPGHRYILGADVSEGVGRHNSTIVILDLDATFRFEGRTFTKPKAVAVYASNKIAPDLFAYEVKAGGTKFGNCMVAPERNNHGFATLAVLKGIYFNIYKDENDKLGWLTNMASKPKMMHELRTAVHEGLVEVVDQALKTEIVSYSSSDLNEANTDEEDETVGHFDRTIALAIAWQLRSSALPSMQTAELSDPDVQDKSFDRYATFNEI